VARAAYLSSIGITEDIDSNLTSNLELKYLVNNEHEDDFLTESETITYQDSHLINAIVVAIDSDYLQKVDSTPTVEEIIVILQQHRAAVQFWQDDIRNHDMIKVEMNEADRLSKVENFNGYLEETGSRVVMIAAD